MYAAFQIPKPIDEQVLERAPLELFRCVLNDPNVATYGRRGQAQQGVDIYGKRDANPSHYVGVQCKLKSGDNVLTEKIVREEVDAALSFEPALVEYFILTTAPDDAKLQKLARTLEVEIQQNHGRQLSIQIWGWNTLEREIQRHPTAIKEFYPDYTPYAQELEKGIQEVSIGQNTIRDKLERIEVGLASKTGVLADFDDQSTGDPLEAHLDGEIDSFCKLLKQGRPKTAFDLLTGLQQRLGTSASDRIHFRLKANIGYCLIELGREQEGLDLLLEACGHTPDTPKSYANQAVAHLFKGNWQEAIEIGRRGLAADPGNEELAGYFVQGLRFDASVSDPLMHVPEGLRDKKQVQFALLFFLQQREDRPAWWDKARDLAELYPDEDFVLQASAEAAIDRVLTEGSVKTRHQVSSDRMEQVAKAYEELFRIWSVWDFTEVVVQVKHLGLFTNLMLACDLLGKVDEAKQLASSCPTSVFADDGVAIRLCQLAFNHGESDLFDQAIRQVEDPIAKFHFEFYRALENREWSTIVSLTNDADAVVQEHEKEIVAVAQQLAKLLIFDGEITPEQLIAIERLVSEDLRGLVLLYDVLLSSGFDDATEGYYVRAVQKIQEEGEHAARSMLAQRAAKRRDWQSVNRLLVGYVDCREDNELLAMLATSYVNITPATKSAVNFFKDLPKEIAQKPYFLERAAVFHFNRGALAQSEECYRFAIKSADQPELGFYMPLFSLLVRRQKLAAVDELVDEMIRLDPRGESEEQIWFAHVLMKHGHPERAISTAYSALSAGPNKAEAHSGYCGLILMNTRLGPDERVVPSVPQVGSDCWVAITRENGERREFLISDEPALEAQHLFGVVVEASNALAQKCMGKRVGDSFEVQDGLAQQVSDWTISEVKHKYSQACYIIMDEFDIRFSGSRQMSKMTMVDGDVQPVLDYIRGYTEQHQKASEYYTKQGFPICILAALKGGTSIEYAGYLRSLGSDILVCRGFAEERDKALELISEKRLEGATIDALTAWTIYWSGAFDVVKQVFGTIRISQTCLDELTRMVVEAENNSGGRFSLVWKDGQYFREEHSAEDIAAYHQRLLKVRDQVVEYCTIIPSEAPDDIPEMSQELISNFSADLLDPAFASLGGGLLLSEDMFYRQFANQEFGVQVVWLQAVLMYARQNEFLEFDAYCKQCVFLAHSGHGHLAVTSDVLAHVAQREDNEAFGDFDALSNVIGTPDADIYSHFQVASAAIAKIWSARGMTERQKREFSGTLIFKLIRNRKDDWAYALSALYILMHREFRHFLQEWMRKQDLPKEEFDKTFLIALKQRYSV